MWNRIRPPEPAPRLGRIHMPMGAGRIMDILFIGREHPLARRAEALRRAGLRVALVPGSDVVLYTYDERRGGSIEVEGEDALAYLDDVYGLSPS